MSLYSMFSNDFFICLQEDCSRRGHKSKCDLHPFCWWCCEECNIPLCIPDHPCVFCYALDKDTWRRILSSRRHRISRTRGTDSFSYGIDDMSHPTVAKPVLLSPSASTAPLHVLPQSDMVSWTNVHCKIFNAGWTLQKLQCKVSLLWTRTLLSRETELVLADLKG